MAQKRPDPLGLAIVAAILASRSELGSDAENFVEEARRLWEACEAESRKPPPEQTNRFSPTQSVTKLLLRKTTKPPTFDAVVRSVVGGAKRAQRMKILHEFLRAEAEQSIRRSGNFRPLVFDGVPLEPSEEELEIRVAVQLKQMEQTGHFTLPLIQRFAEGFQRWKHDRDRRTNHERAVKGGVARAAKASKTPA